MSNTPSSGHSVDCYYSGEDHPYRTCHGDIITPEGGVLQLIHPTEFPAMPGELTQQEQREAGFLYMQSRYGKSGPIYDAMVSRETDGSDPLVQEPKGKP